jgi:hypothetical protein
LTEADGVFGSWSFQFLKTFKSWWRRFPNFAYEAKKKSLTEMAGLHISGGLRLWKVLNEPILPVPKIPTSKPRKKSLTEVAGLFRDSASTVLRVILKSLRRWFLRPSGQVKWKKSLT